jgi:hypothetical protein
MFPKKSKGCPFVSGLVFCPPVFVSLSSPPTGWRLNLAVGVDPFRIGGNTLSMVKWGRTLEIG